jgi:hypothetical protein
LPGEKRYCLCHLLRTKSEEEAHPEIGNHASREFRELDLLTDSHVKLDTLVQSQESFSISHHRIALEFDEDTVSLVVDPTLSTSDISISNNSDSSTGNASAFEYECYEVKDDTPQFN